MGRRGTFYPYAQIGSTINRPVLVSAIAENTARNGNTFVRVSLKDGFSEVTAMMFDASAESLASLGIRQNTIADAELSVSEYQGSKSFKIVQIRPTADSTLTVNDFTKLPPVDLDLMYNEICSLIESTANDYDGKLNMERSNGRVMFDCRTGINRMTT